MKLNRLTKLLASAGVLLAVSWGAQAAVTLDLTTAGATGAIGAGTYTQVGPQPTGTGYINSFVRISAANQDLVQGYNTTVNNVFDNVSSDQFDHEITVGQVGLLNIGTIATPINVMRFLLDINQTGADPLLNLDEVQIFISTVANQSIESFTGTGLVDLASSFLVYRMDDAANDNKVTLNYSLETGSGSGDMILDITEASLNAAFAAAGLVTNAAKNAAFIYLYSSFGSAPNNNNDGFEEWAHAVGGAIGEPPCVPTPLNPCGPVDIPEPGSIALVGLGLVGAGIATRRRRQV